MLTADDIKKKEFSRGFRGYDISEVDAFIEKLCKEYEYLCRDNLELRETVERVSSKLEYYQQMESTMQSTLTVAQETADEVKANSEKKAAVLEEDTRIKCENQLVEAKNVARKIRDDAVVQAEHLYNTTKIKVENMLNATNAECSRLKDEARSFADNLRRTTEMNAEKLKSSTEEICKRRSNSAMEEANLLLNNARGEVGKMMLEANTNYRKIVGDAEEKSRKLIFEAESRVAEAKSLYEDQLKKAGVHRQHMVRLLESQLEMLKNFDNREQ